MSETARPRTAPAWKTLGVGGAAGLTSCVLLQPMDLLKTRMQQERLPTASHATATQRLVRAFQSVVHDSGYRGLWRGTVPTVARNVPGVAAYFYTLNEVRWLVAKWQVPGLSTLDTSTRTHRSSTLARLSSTGNIVTGALARVTIGLILNPISIVKARYESSHYSKDAYPTLWASLRSLYHDGGVRGFFRGFSATALRDAPYAGLYLAFYEQHKHSLGYWARGESGAWWVVSASSLGAGILATVITHPFDILKTRMQTTPQALLPDASTSYRPSVIATARRIFQTDGARAFADGLGLRCARKAASSMIGWSIFEVGQRWVS